MFAVSMKAVINKKNHRILMSIIILALAGCGGGGTDSGSTPVQTPTEPTPPAPVNSPPSGTVNIVGENVVGATLSIEQDITDSNGIGVFSYQWYRNQSAITGATNDNYEVVETDQGNSITVTLNYTDGDGFLESVTSEAFDIATVIATPTTPNILFIISDDQGLDASNQYAYSNDTPSTPYLDELANQGVIFDNVWATPACTTSRAAMLTGRHGVNSGVTYIPAIMDTELQTLAKYLKSPELETPYQTAAFGKWHLAGGGNADPNHPTESGFDFFAGNIGNIEDYYAWELTVNGEQSISDVYHTTEITSQALNWIQNQTSPWFAWLAYQAPHSPFHLPPTTLHSRDSLTGDEDDIEAHPRDYYLASIDALDTEIGRLLSSLDAQIRDNTVIIYIGDNGTPRRVIDDTVFNRQHSKSTLYEGGLRVPMFITGASINRQGEREDAIVNATDLFATVGQIAGIDTQQIYDSTSLYGLLMNRSENHRNENYSEFESDTVTGWAVKDDNLKLIQYVDGSQELFDISNVLDEGEDISQDMALAEAITRLSSIGLDIRGEAQQPGTPIDITDQLFTNRSQDCQSYVESYQSTVLDVNNSIVFAGELTIEVSNGKCIFSTNAIPNHDFNDGAQAFPNDVAVQDDRYEITTTPTFANSITALSLQTDNAILLNGVKVDLLAAGCFGIGNGKTGCGDINQPWRYDPMFIANGFNIDSHNAHAQGDGTYHYHGTPNAFYHAENNGTESPVVGFAADGFPIFGPYFDDGGSIRKAQSSYRLKAGQRPSGDGEPGGTYDGAFRDDYEFVEGAGDLDECNGMIIDGVYGYFITDEYPYILSCFSGTPDPSFNK